MKRYLWVMEWLYGDEWVTSVWLGQCRAMARIEQKNFAAVHPHVKTRIVKYVPQEKAK